ncbi:MAG: polysaccharide deacetylase family protein [bacterium]|nr:polysaccharide deacetylase family protein [bacterium]
MPKLLITVDAEPSRYHGRPLPYEITMEGRLDGGVWGVDHIMDLSEAIGGKATFFLDVLARRVYETELKETAARIAGRGHDIQVHTHPLWVGDRNTMPEYTRDEQRALLAECADCIEEWTGIRPVAHRAGDLAVNGDTLKALQETGLDLDSSYAPGYPPCANLGDTFADSRASRADGLIQLPLTSFSAVRLGSIERLRLFDFNAVTATEIRALLKQALALELPYVMVLLHSFSLLRMNAERTSFRFDPDAEARLLSFLATAKDLGFEPTTVRDYRRSLLAEHGESANDGMDTLAVDGPAPTPPLPVTGPWITYLSAVERARYSPKARLVALAPPAALLLLILVLLIFMR